MLLLNILLLPSVVFSGRSYSPQDVMCPLGDLVRSGSQGLSIAEKLWIKNRDVVSRAALTEWLKRSNLEQIDIPSFLNTISDPDRSTIRIGLAFSGGGFRAMLSGAGTLSAMDGRTPGALGPGGMGGLLQSSSYITGLSGGAWLVTSVAINNWDTIPSLQANRHIWNFESPLNPSVDRRILRNFHPDWDLSVVSDIGEKARAGFPISITDVWGRLLGAQLIGGKDNGRNARWSDLAYAGPTSQYQMPMPIFISDGISLSNITTINPQDSELLSLLNSTVYEISPYEFGSWDPNLNAFMSTQYLGSEMRNGRPTSGSCVIGYDNVGFLAGASSTIFNKVVDSMQLKSSVGLFSSIMHRLGQSKELEVAVIGSNPFNEMNNVDENIKHAQTLDLVDGGEDGQNLPLTPLIQAGREVDIIFAMDNSADTKWNWPNGTALLKTSIRQQILQGKNSSSFPYIPKPEVFVDLGLNTRPTFFGCEVDSFQQKGANPPPLVVYVPNSPHFYFSNTSTFKFSYTDKERDNMIFNGYNIFTQNNGALDPEWRTCAACAVLLREQQRRNVEPTLQCQRCFSRYCFRGTPETQ